jgi:hypothetical protein
MRLCLHGPAAGRCRPRNVGGAPFSLGTLPAGRSLRAAAAEAAEVTVVSEAAPAGGASALTTTAEAAEQKKQRTKRKPAKPKAEATDGSQQNPSKDGETGAAALAQKDRSGMGGANTRRLLLEGRSVSLTFKPTADDTFVALKTLRDLSLSRQFRDSGKSLLLMPSIQRLPGAAMPAEAPTLPAALQPEAASQSDAEAPPAAEPSDAAAAAPAAAESRAEALERNARRRSAEKAAAETPISQASPGTTTAGHLPARPLEARLNARTPQLGQPTPGASSMGWPVAPSAPAGPLPTRLLAI